MLEYSIIVEIFWSISDFTWFVSMLFSYMVADDRSFRVLRKCLNKFDCLIFERFLIRDLKPKLNKQSDSICAKLCV